MQRTISKATTSILLIVAANQSDAHLSDEEIDEILGLVPEQRTGD